MLLNTYNHHYNETHFIFITFGFISSLGLFMLYLCDLFLIFSLIFTDINHIKSLKTRLFFVYFLENPLSFSDDNADEESE